MNFKIKFSIVLAFILFTAKSGVATHIYAEYDPSQRTITVDFRSAEIKSSLEINSSRQEKLNKSHEQIYPIACEITEDKYSKDEIVKKLNIILEKMRANSYIPLNLKFWGVTNRKYLYLACKFQRDAAKLFSHKRRNLTIDCEEPKSYLPHIVIPIRGTFDDKDAKGTFYDHFVFQTITTFPTGMLLPSNTTKGVALRYMSPYAKQLPYGLPYGEIDALAAKHLPKIIDKSFFKEGLLVIPGRMRKREYESEREKLEKQLLRQAFLRGQPILAVCAGSWRLWQELWIMNLYPDYQLNIHAKINIENMLLKDEECEDHTAPRMMCLSPSNPQIGYNLMIHGLDIIKESLLYNFLSYGIYKAKDGRASIVHPPADMQVNSVHWKAPQLNLNADNEGKTKPFGIEISAVSKNTKALNKKNRSGRMMNPKENVIEAFSSHYGAPIIGIGWHPEASNRKDEAEKFPLFNHSLIKNMAKAGQAYHYKQIVLSELKQYSLDHKLLSKSEAIKTYEHEDDIEKLMTELGIW